MPSWTALGRQAHFLKKNGVSRIGLDAFQKRIAFDTDESAIALCPRPLQPLEGFVCFPSKGLCLGHLKSRRGSACATSRH
jgi:hypothetical protein